jgi:regulator of sigma E protease
MISSILVFLLVLSILVLVHELGHFIVAKRFGVMVEEFGLGLPPRLFGKKIGETTYSINALPFGGFVKLHGENSEEEITHPKRSFLKKKKRIRIAIIVAGVIMNFILAIFAFAITYSFNGIPKTTKDVKIVDISTSSPAQIAGLVVGDIVRRVGKTEISTNDEFINLVDQEKGKKVTLEIERVINSQKTTKKITLTPRVNPPEGEGSMGVVITTAEVYYPPVFLRPFYGIYYGFGDAIFWGKNVILGFYGIFAGLFKGQIPQDVAGPVGIFALTSEASKIGIFALINFIGILSVNLAILNVLPFPALDGGRLFFIFLEGVIGKKVLPKVEAAVHTVGMIILLALLLAVTAHDIIRLIAAGSISGFIKSVVK